MLPMSLVLDKKTLVKMVVLVGATFSLLFATPADSLNLPVAQETPAHVAPMDTSEIALDSVSSSPAQNIASVESSPDSLLSALSADSSSVKNPDTLTQKVEAVSSGTLDSADKMLSMMDNGGKRPKKSVLYLSGGDNSVWFHLGVLYAIESYSIPVDSVVASSWGAYVGFLWSKGLSLDDIQRLLLDPYMADYVGCNEFDDLYKEQRRNVIFPLSSNGISSLRYRFALSADSSGKIQYDAKNLEPDSIRVKRTLFELRLRESMYRQPVEFVIPFAVAGTAGENENVVEGVFESLPLIENTESGELDSYLALPREDSMDEVALIAVATPTAAQPSSWMSPWGKVLARRDLENLNSQPGIIIRAHTVLDSSHKAWIQAGFSAVERRLGELMELRTRKVDYAGLKRKSVPWFKFNPVFDSLSAELHSVVKSYWAAEDTNMAAPENFAYKLIQNPVYDSLDLQMLPNGELLVDASVKPTFDVYAGGFGSNALGPNAYAGVSLSYVNQMEFALSLSGFWGNRSYGFEPNLRISRLWNKNWSVFLGYEWTKLKPLESYGNDVSSNLRIYSELRNDIRMSIDYQIDDLQKVSANFLLGKRSFALNPIYYADEFETRPISPSLRYELVSGDGTPWFSLSGFFVKAEAGMQSISFDFGRNDVIPIYYKANVEAQYSASPKPYLTFAAAVAGGIDGYHDEGHGYVYPKSFEYEALNNCFRQRVLATPWSTEWYNVDLSSHHYGMIRLNAALHREGNGFWIFGAYVRDYEDNSMTLLDKNKFVLEPAIRLAYKSLSAYFGISQMVDSDSFGDLKELKEYNYFVRIGNYDLF